MLSPISIKPFDLLFKDLRDHVEKLSIEINERQKAENELKQYHNQLENLVQERTAELEEEIDDRKQIELNLKQREDDLREVQMRTEQAVKAGNVGLWDWDLKTDKVRYSVEWKRQIGYEDDEIKDEFEEWRKRVHPDDIEDVLENINKIIEGNKKEYRAEFRFQHKNGSYCWILAQGSIVLDESGKTIRMLGSHTDITDQKNQEEQINCNLKEKETLLKEVHHRVKNNMNVISGLLSLHRKATQNEEVKRALQESQGRVYAMSAMHETLYNSTNLAEIDLIPYLNKISRSLIQSYLVNPDKVQVKIDGSEVKLNMNNASPLGLIINELVSNALKYAFPDNRNGQINITTRNRDNQLELIIEDNGVGMPAGFDWKKSKSLGLNLVRNLAENQLDGSIELKKNNGTHFTIIIPNE